MLDVANTTMGQGGRVVIPSAFREQHGIKEGDEVRITCDQYGYHIVPIALAWQQAQDFFSSHTDGDESLVDELIHRRRLEAKQERQENS